MEKNKLTIVIVALLMFFSLTANALTVNVDTTVDAAVGTDTSASTDLKFEANAVGVRVVNANQVSSEADLEIFAENAEIQDKNVSEVKMEEDGEVKVEYKHKGKLFGFIPIKVKSETTVKNDSEGKVVAETKLPWWRIFVSGVSETKSKVEENLSGSASIASNTETGISAQNKARIVEAIISAHAEAEASISGSGSDPYSDDFSDDEDPDEAPKPTGLIISFDGCVAAGYPVAESYPRRCYTPDGKSFTEDIEVENDGQVFCTMDAKICPDGSFVGRIGPNCEFAPCP